VSGLPPGTEQAPVGSTDLPARQSPPSMLLGAPYRSSSRARSTARRCWRPTSSQALRRHRTGPAGRIGYWGQRPMDVEHLIRRLSRP